MAGAERRKRNESGVRASADLADSKASPKKLDLWPEGLGQPPWAQGGTGGMACTAFAVGAAVYWHELRKHPERDPGTPDFQFIFNNEAFLTRSIVRYFEAEERGQNPDSPVAFSIMAAARVAAVFGVPFVPPGTAHPAPKFTFTSAPPHKVFVAAREHLYAFHLPVRVARVDPNHPEAKKRPRTSRHRAVREALLRGSPVVMGINSSRNRSLTSALDEPADVSPLGGKRFGTVTSAHAVLVVGFDDTTKRFRFRNSWGPKWGTNGYATIPYDWIDSEEATFGFTTFSQPDGVLRPFVMFDRIRVDNRGPVDVCMDVSAHDGRCNYLGTWKCAVQAGQRADFNPVRWLDTYRLDVVVRPPETGGDVRRFRMWVDDDDGAVASSAEIVVHGDGQGTLSGRLHGARGAHFGTVSRAIDPSERPVPVSAARGA